MRVDGGEQKEHVEKYVTVELTEFLTIKCVCQLVQKQ